MIIGFQIPPIMQDSQKGEDRLLITHTIKDRPESRVPAFWGIDWLRGLDLNQRPSGYENVVKCTAR